MCVVAFAWNAHPRWRLVLAGNRDEFHARPTAALARWDDAPVSGGRDLEAGGTWLGVGDDGRCALVTNVRDLRAPQDGLSRGLLASDWLRGDTSAPASAEALLARADAYRPFNLLLFDRHDGRWLGNHPSARLQPLRAGVHALSNAELDTPWPKTRALAARLQDWLDASRRDAGDAPHDAATAFAPLLAALADPTVHPDADLPDTGIGLERERWLSSAFIRGTGYGTRASTVVALAHDGGGVMIERRWGPDGIALGETTLALPR